MADAKPSLTPHRDAVEKIFAEGAASRAGFNIPTRLASDVNFAIHRALADARDQGASIDDLLTFAPSLVRRAAQTIIDHFMVQPEGPAIDRLLKLALDPPIKGRRISDVTVDIAKTHTVGQA